MPSKIAASRDVTALVLGAGEGQRFGGQPKAFVLFDGQTLLARAIQILSPWAGTIVIAVRREDVARARREYKAPKTGPRVVVIAGGSTRQKSLQNLLAVAVTPYVLVHEVARPWAQPGDFKKLISTVKRCSAAMLFTRLAVHDTLAVEHAGQLEEILPRSAVIALQTPHAFTRKLLREVYAKAALNRWNESSTAALLRKAGAPVRLIEGSPLNMKITYPQDVDRAKVPVRRFRALSAEKPDHSPKRS